MLLRLNQKGQIEGSMVKKKNQNTFKNNFKWKNMLNRSLIGWVLLLNVTQCVIPWCIGVKEYIVRLKYQAIIGNRVLINGRVKLSVP